MGRIITTVLDSEGRVSSMQVANLTATQFAYDVRVRTVVSPVFTAAFPVRVSRSVVRRRSVYRIRIAEHRDLADVVRLLAQAGVDVLDIRVLSVHG